MAEQACLKLNDKESSFRSCIRLNHEPGNHLRSDVEGQSLCGGHLYGSAPGAAAQLLRLARLQAGEPLLPGGRDKLRQQLCSAFVK